MKRPEFASTKMISALAYRLVVVSFSTAVFKKPQSATFLSEKNYCLAVSQPRLAIFLLICVTPMMKNYVPTSYMGWWLESNRESLWSLTDVSAMQQPGTYEETLTIIIMTSQWARWRLKSPVSPLFTQSFIRAQIKENIKAPRHWPLCGEFTGDRWIPRTNGQ